MPPRRGTVNHVFVRVHNRGTDASAPAADVKVFAARALLGQPPRWRLPSGSGTRWVELAPGAGAVTTAVVVPSAVNSVDFVDFGPFEWRPQLAGHHALLACVDAPGDRCNALTATLACAVGPTRIERLVPFDNNIAYVSLVVVS
jgi:hypothetical protein